MVECKFWKIADREECDRTSIITRFEFTPYLMKVKNDRNEVSSRITTRIGIHADDFKDPRFESGLFQQLPHDAALDRLAIFNNAAR